MLVCMCVKAQVKHRRRARADKDSRLSSAYVYVCVCAWKWNTTQTCIVTMKAHALHPALHVKPPTKIVHFYAHTRFRNHKIGEFLYVKAHRPSIRALARQRLTSSIPLGTFIHRLLHRIHTHTPSLHINAREETNMWWARPIEKEKEISVCVAKKDRELALGARSAYVILCAKGEAHTHTQLLLALPPALCFSLP
jgi:hypothetical protein